MFLDKAKYNLVKIVSNDYFFELFRYLIRHKRIPNFKSPKTFNEKIAHLKLFNKNDNSHLCDKYLVKKHVKNKIGDKYVLDTLFVTSDPNSIPFEKLPKSFIIKSTHASGWNIIVKNKKNIDLKNIINKCKLYLSMNYFYLGREYQYKNIKPQIIIEDLLVDESGNIPKDYKFFCFNGEVKYIQVDIDREANHKRNFYDIKWRKMPFELNYPGFEKNVTKPSNLNEMIEISKILSEGLPFSRIDLYSIFNNVFFGEITLTPENNLGKFSPVKYDEILGNFLAI